MLSLLILSFSHLTYCHTVIRLGLFPDGNPYVNGSIPSIPGFQNISIGITPYDDARLHMASPEREVCDDLPDKITIQLSENFSFDTENYVFCEYSDDNTTSPVTSIGIGPQSPLVRQYGSVDFIKSMNSSFLVVNSTLEWFENTACNSETVLNIPFFGDHGRVNMTVGFAGNSDNSSLVYELVSKPFLMMIPARMLARLLVIIEDAGGRRRIYPGDSVTFSDCDRISPLLPELDVTFASGMIRLSPEDYIKPVGNDTCQLLLTFSRRNIQTDFINPFLLPNINVRFTNSSLYLCDSVVNSFA